MHVPVQLRLAIDDVTGAQEALGRLRALHDAEIAKLEKRLKTSPNETALREAAALAERGRRLTLNSVVRLVVRKGLAAIKNESDEKLIAQIAQDPVVWGRTRG